MDVAFFLMVIFIYIHFKAYESAGKNFVSFLVFLAALLYGFAIMPSTHIVLEFGSELADPLPPACCHLLMITLANIFSIIGVRYKTAEGVVRDLRSRPHTALYRI
jgi:hypothetical protein